MRQIVLCVAAMLVIGLGLDARETRAADDLEFATPVVTGYLPTCADGSCSAAHMTESARRRPIVSWFEEHRPLRRVVRGAARLIGNRCCR
jgi:hypothetical protein